MVDVIFHQANVGVGHRRHQLRVLVKPDAIVREDVNLEVEKWKKKEFRKNKPVKMLEQKNAGLTLKSLYRMGRATLTETFVNTYYTSNYWNIS